MNNLIERATRTLNNRIIAGKGFDRFLIGEHYRFDNGKIFTIVSIKPFTLVETTDHPDLGRQIGGIAWDL